MTDVLPISQIDNVNWQMRLGDLSGDADHIGEIVTDFEDIDQAIRIILTTPIGSVPLRPDFGSRLYDLLGEPVALTLSAIEREAGEAIARHETRITVTGVRAAHVSSAPGHVRLTVSWQEVEGAASGETIAVVGNTGEAVL